MNAEELFKQIGYGKAQAVVVKNNSRAFRDLVQQANLNGDCIINVGNGYYRPDNTKPDEIEEAEHYFNSELHRAQMIREKAFKMRSAFAKNGAQITFL